MKPWIHQYDKSKDEVYLHPSATHYAAEEFVKKWWQIYTDAFPSSETSVSLEVCMYVRIRMGVSVFR